MQAFSRAGRPGVRLGLCAGAAAAKPGRAASSAVWSECRLLLTRKEAATTSAAASKGCTSTLDLACGRPARASAGSIAPAKTQYLLKRRLGRSQVQLGGAARAGAQVLGRSWWWSNEQALL